MNNLMIFENKQVEVFEWNGQVLFNPYHCGECLDLSPEGVRKAITRMNERQVIKLTNSKVTDSNFRKLHNTGENFLTESGMYKLIFKSHKEEAEKFQDWVTDEVLPSIRKTGSYNVGEEFKPPTTYKEALLQLVQAEEEKEQLQLESKQKDQIINELQPKATYYDFILQNKSLLAISVIAKDYGMSGTALNKKLHELKIQYLQCETWLLYAKYQDKGYTSSKTKNYPKSDGTQGSKLHTYWTQKGRLFIYDLLKQEGILPIIEREVV